MVQVGTPLFELVQVDRLKATGRFPAVGVCGRARAGGGDQILDGTAMAGGQLVASAADPETRSFAVEILVENPDLLRAAGGTLP